MWGVQKKDKKKGKTHPFFHNTLWGHLIFFITSFLSFVYITLLREHTHTHKKRNPLDLAAQKLSSSSSKKNTATPKEVRKKGRRRRRRRSRDVLGAPFGVVSRWEFSSARDFGIAAPGLFSFCRVSSRLFAARAGANDVF